MYGFGEAIDGLISFAAFALFAFVALIGSAALSIWMPITLLQAVGVVLVSGFIGLFLKSIWLRD